MSRRRSYRQPGFESVRGLTKRWLVRDHHHGVEGGSQERSDPLREAVMARAARRTELVEGATLADYLRPLL
jgi:hypothetical protein